MQIIFEKMWRRKERKKGKGTEEKSYSSSVLRNMNLIVIV
jgi:hypothetical protein